MTQLDAKLSELATGVNLLPIRSLVALFWACSDALMPAFQAWAELRGDAGEPLLHEAQAVARGFARSGAPPAQGEFLLGELAAAAPPGDSPDEYSSTAAQDCWICADVGIRVLVDRQYGAGPAIEYALEPILAAATEELFGVSQVGSGNDEESQLSELLQHPRVAAAIEFCTWATQFLQGHPEPTDADLVLLGSRASVLVP